MGDGSFSTVILAMHKATKQLYAIKLVNKHLVSPAFASRQGQPRAMHAAQSTDPVGGLIIYPWFRVPQVLRNKMVEYIKNERTILDRLENDGMVKLEFTFQDADSLCEFPQPHDPLGRA